MAAGPHSSTPSELAERLAADREGHPYLLLRDPRGHQQLVPLGTDRLTLGREPGNDLVLYWDEEVSRAHAQLERIGEQWTVIDDGLSRNGTFVNGARLARRRRLEDGDVVRCGRTELFFRHPGITAGETVRPADPATVVGVTPAQKRILVALCRPVVTPGGLPVPASNGEVAEELHLSLDGVRSQLKSLFRLFDIPELPQQRKRAELVHRALECGVVTHADLDA